MEGIVDSSVWVDYFRPKTPNSVKKQVGEVIDSAGILLCEPVRFEILRRTPASALPWVERTFTTLPLLATPADLWSGATDLGMRCSRRGFQIPSLDLLIAQIALKFNVPVVTFDAEFELIQKVSPLNLHLLRRAV